MTSPVAVESSRHGEPVILSTPIFVAAGMKDQKRQALLAEVIAGLGHKCEKCLIDALVARLLDRLEIYTLSTELDLGPNESLEQVLDAFSGEVYADLDALKNRMQLREEIELHAEVLGWNSLLEVLDRVDPIHREEPLLSRGASNSFSDFSLDTDSPELQNTQHIDDRDSLSSHLEELQANAIAGIESLDSEVLDSLTDEELVALSSQSPVARLIDRLGRAAALTADHQQIVEAHRLNAVSASHLGDNLDGTEVKEDLEVDIRDLETDALREVNSQLAVDDDELDVSADEADFALWEKELEAGEIQVQAIQADGFKEDLEPVELAGGMEHVSLEDVDLQAVDAALEQDDVALGEQDPTREDLSLELEEQNEPELESSDLELSEQDTLDLELAGLEVDDDELGLEAEEVADEVEPQPLGLGQETPGLEVDGDYEHEADARLIAAPGVAVVLSKELLDEYAERVQPDAVRGVAPRTMNEIRSEVNKRLAAERQEYMRRSRLMAEEVQRRRLVYIDVTKSQEKELVSQLPPLVSFSKDKAVAPVALKAAKGKAEKETWTFIESEAEKRKRLNGLTSNSQSGTPVKLKSKAEVEKDATSKPMRRSMCDGCGGGLSCCGPSTVGSKMTEKAQQRQAARSVDIAPARPTAPEGIELIDISMGMVPN